jgi:acyl-CoA reductase-like NAD-dependent aldehyde dehydrogenase
MRSFRPDLFTAQPCALLRSEARAAVDASAQIRHYDLIIGGENVPVAAGETFETVSPATNAPVGRMAKAGVEDVDRPVAVARKAFDEGPWPRMTPLERSRIMHKIATLLRERLSEIAVMETTNCGKIIVESRGDVTSSANCFEYYAGLATQLWAEQIPMNGPLLDYTLREPVGVCAQIVPWNFPLLMAG